ncbi:MAG: hypothetical protein SFW67_30890 [Myxococcaceae bacterium]|nr:hypothetical protein [Myxococcaceae bacterium]
MKETLSNATDPVSFGRFVAARSVQSLSDGGQTLRVHLIEPGPDAGWADIAALDIASNNSSGALVVRDGGLLLVAPRDTIREIDALADGGWQLGPQLLPPVIPGERSRTFTTAAVFDGTAFVAGGEGVYAFRQPKTGLWVSTATQANRNRPINAICEGPLPERPIAISEGSVLLERQTDATWRRYDTTGTALPSTFLYRQCVGAPGGRSIVVGDLASVFEYRSPNLFTRMDGGFNATLSDGGQLSWTGVAITPTNELFAVGLVGDGSSRVLNWRLGQTPRVVSVLGDELTSATSLPSGGGAITWFAGPSGIAFANDDGGFGPASIVPQPNPGAVVATSSARLLFSDGGTIGYAVGPRGAIWRRPTPGGFRGLRQAVFSEDFSSVWASPLGEAFIGGTRDSGVPTPEPAVFLFREDAGVFRVDPLPLSSLGPAGVTGFHSSGGTIEVFIGGAQGAILRKSFPADGG